MPKALPADGVRKAPLTTRWTATDRARLEAEAARVGVPLSRVLEVSVDRLLGLAESTRDKLLAP